MHSLHDYCCRRFQWYSRWHAHRYHTHHQWGMAVLVIVIAVSTVVSTMFLWGKESRLYGFISPKSAHAQSVVVINTQLEYQTIDGFGVEVGGVGWGSQNDWNSYSDTAKDGLFDTMVGELGLSVIRHVVPWGESGSDGKPGNDNSDPWNSDMSRFDPARIAYRPNDPAKPNAYDGMVNTDIYELNELKNRGIQRFFLSAFAYPGWLLDGSCPAQGSYGGNIDPTKLDEAAEYLYGVTRSFKERYNMNFEAISLINEPEYCYRYSGADLDRLVPLVKKRFQCVGAPAGSNCTPMSIKIMAPEHSHAELSLSSYGITYNANNYAADMDILGYHQYNFDAATMRQNLLAIGQFSQQYGKPNWQTEAANGGIWNVDTLDEGIDLAADIHNALTLANTNVWIFFIERHEDAPGAHNSPFRLFWMHAPDYSVSPKTYAFKKFTRYIPQGSVRVNVTGALPATEYCQTSSAVPCVSAYKLPTGGMTVVAVNHSSSNQSVTFSFSGSSVSSLNRIQYAAPCILTTASSDYTGCDESLATVTPGNSITLPGKSVTTFTTLPVVARGSGGSNGGGGNPTCGDGTCNGTETTQSCPVDCTSPGGVTPPPPGGDPNLNCDAGPNVDVFDLALLMYHWDPTGTSSPHTVTCPDNSTKSADLTTPADNKVSVTDLARLAECWGSPSSCARVGGTLPPVCGNSKVETGEACDGGIGSQTCLTRGFTSGTLTCNVAGTANQCQFNTSQCISSGTAKFNPSFPRIGVLYFYEVATPPQANIPAEIWKYHDLVATRDWYPEIAQKYRSAYPDRTILAASKTIDGSDLHPSDAWLIKTVSGPCVGGWSVGRHPGDCMYNGTDFAPLVSIVEFGSPQQMRWSDYFAQAIGQERMDWTLFDGVFFDSWSSNLQWANNGTQADMNNDGIADSSQSATVVGYNDRLEQYTIEGNRKLIQKLRLKTPAEKIILAHEASAVEAEYLNGLGDEFWDGKGWQWWYDNIYKPYADNAVSTRVSMYEGESAPEDYAFMRYGLTTASLLDAYFSMDDKSLHRFTFLYDEYLGDLGQSIGAPQQIVGKPSVYVRYFTNGAVITNGSGNPQAITDTNLKGVSGYAGPYYRFKGGQAPLFNNGLQVTDANPVQLVGSGDQGSSQKGDGVLLFKQPTTMVMDIVIDNVPRNMTSPGSSPVIYGGSWTQVSPGSLTTSSMGYGLFGLWDWWGVDVGSMYAKSSQAGETATYQPTIGAAGSYDVYEWHPDIAADGQGSTCTSVPVSTLGMTCAAGFASSINQSASTAGKWNRLGTCTMSTGSSAYVRLTASNTNGCTTVSDAIKFTATFNTSP